jgi:predicted hotdog family 3-hydroxylacyl-ACP dehydratase
MSARGREWIAANLPHQGTMSLLAEIVDWDAQRLRARATSHRDAANPLRRGGELPIACGIEYGAQAVAAHGALASEAPSGPGFLASVRSVAFHATRLDDVREDLDIEVEQIGRGAGGLLYRFALTAGTRPLLAGRLAIVLGEFRFPRDAG